MIEGPGPPATVRVTGRPMPAVPRIRRAWMVKTPCPGAAGVQPTRSCCCGSCSPARAAGSRRRARRWRPSGRARAAAGARDPRIRHAPTVAARPCRRPSGTAPPSDLRRTPGRHQRRLRRRRRRTRVRCETSCCGYTATRPDVPAATGPPRACRDDPMPTGGGGQRLSGVAFETAVSAPGTEATTRRLPRSAGLSTVFENVPLWVA